jgi:hypothetical protein
MMVPARIAQAGAPWLFGLCLDRFGAGAIWLSAAISLAAWAALMALRHAQPSHANADPARSPSA